MASSLSNLANNLSKGIHRIKYHKISLIRHGCIYGQRANLMGVYSGGAYIREEKHFNLQSVKLITFVSFFQYKPHISAYFTLLKM